ncbi:MAG: type IV secretion protein IcmK [Legionellales bacterium]|nr:type IV secretion protein IcmK [Legionellales bacterium]
MSISKLQINIYCGLFIFVFFHFAFSAPANELRQLEQLASIQAKKSEMPANNKSNDVQVGNTTVNNQNVPAYQEGNSQIPQDEDDPQRNVAFDKVLDTLYPLTPGQILQMRDRHEDTARAKEATSIDPPKPVITSQFVKLSPGTTPPIVRLAEGFVSALVFLDSTGAPWPIESYNLSDPNSFSLSWNKVDNIIVVQAKRMFKDGNLIVRLEGLDTPVGVSLIPGQREIDFRRELRVQGHGPKAKSYVGDLYPDKENSLLLGVLDGVPPVGSVDIESSHSAVDAWRLGPRMYIRTNSRILSPAWVSSIKSADGMRVYEMNATTSVLITNKGKVETVYFKG